MYVESKKMTKCQCTFLNRDENRERNIEKTKERKIRCLPQKEKAVDITKIIAKNDEEDEE